MELNIDVQGQLFPNVATVIVQLLATAIIVLFIRKYLWKYAKQYLQDKSALTQKPLEEALKREEAASLAQQEAEAKLSDAVLQAKSLVESGEKEGKRVQEEMIVEGQKKVDQMMDDAKRQMNQEREKMEASMKAQIIDVALAATEKLMKDNATSTAHKSAIEDFVKEVSNG